MGWLKRLARKAGGKLLLKAGRVGLGALTGGQSEAVIRGAGLLKQGFKAAKVSRKLGKMTGPQLLVTAAKSNVPSPAARISNTATAMPGGSPIRGSTSAKAKKAGASFEANRAAKGKGGKLNFAAMSKAWAAKGRPGTWQGWIKSNPIRT